MNKYQVQQLIQDEHKNGSNKTSAFSNICSVIGLESPPIDKISKWFKAFHNQNVKLLEGIDNDYFELLELVANNYAMFNRVKVVCSFTEDSVFLPNDSKFAFDFQKDDPHSLIIINCCNGKKKWAFCII